MKEVKAYIRRHMVNKVVAALEEGGFREMTLIDVRGVTSGVRDEEMHYSLELSEKYMNVVKLEIICRDGDAQRIVGLIKSSARTGRKGDGIVFITPVEHAVRIYAEGEGSEGDF